MDSYTQHQLYGFGGTEPSIMRLTVELKHTAQDIEKLLEQFIRVRQQQRENYLANGRDLLEQINEKKKIINLKLSKLMQEHNKVIRDNIARSRR